MQVSGKKTRFECMSKCTSKCTSMFQKRPAIRFACADAMVLIHATRMFTRELKRNVK